MNNQLSMSFQCESSGLKRLMAQFMKKPHVPRKTKKVYKRRYGKLWRLNYEIHTGQRQVAITDHDGKIHIMPRTFEIKQDNEQVTGRWTNK